MASPHTEPAIPLQSDVDPHATGQDPTIHTATQVASALLGIGGEVSAPRRELSPEALAGIENMTAPAGTKVNYLLVALDAKPAAWEHIQTPAQMDTQEHEPPPAMPDDLVEEYVKVARDAGIAVIVGRQGTMGRIGRKHATTLELFLGSSRVNAERLQDAVLANNYDSHAVGIALGYPETAVDAFVNQHRALTIAPSQVPGIDPEVDMFAGFRLSADHYKEELETARRWAETVKAVSPRIYAELFAHRA